MKPIFEIEGHQGYLIVYEDRITIGRKGLNSFLLHGLKGEKEIFISDLTAIQFKKPGLMFVGFIQFSFMGGNDAGRGLFQAVADENTITFKNNKLKAFTEAKDFIQLKMKDGKGVKHNGSNVEDIEKLFLLKEKGFITDEEFSAKKTQLLGL